MCHRCHRLLPVPVHQVRQWCGSEWSGASLSDTWRDQWRHLPRHAWRQQRFHLWRRWCQLWNSASNTGTGSRVRWVDFRHLPKCWPVTLNNSYKLLVDGSGKSKDRFHFNYYKGGSVVSVTLNVFSRDCFPDVTNPGIDAEDVANGCQDAENFQEFFENRFMQGLTILRGMTAQLNDIGGTICFCNDKDKCNDCKLLEENKCVGNGAGNVAFVHYHLMFMAASLSTWCAQWKHINDKPFSSIVELTKVFYHRRKGFVLFCIYLCL